MKPQQSARNLRTFLCPMEPKEKTEDLIHRAFSLVARPITTCEGIADEGCVLAAVDPSGGHVVVSSMRPGNSGGIASAVLGRHDSSDLSLRMDASLSLKHVVVLVSKGDEGGAHTRILDLRSGTGMVSLDGRAHYALASDGPMALRIGNSALFTIPNSLLRDGVSPEGLFESIDWPRADSWIPMEPPEKKLSDSKIATGRSSIITMKRPFAQPGTRTGRDGDLMGSVKVRSDGGDYEYLLGALDLRAGVLVGRYPRCDLSLREADLPATLSRVHALFISIGERVHVFDLASTNGIIVEEIPVRSMALPEHMPVTMELGDAELTWWPRV